MTLIEELEAATEGSRELDARIAQAAYPDLRQGGGGLWYLHDVHVRIEPYTTSIDSALTLVPAGWLWGLHLNDIRDIFGGGLTQAFVREASDDRAAAYHHAEAASAALALCIAALKAREQINDAD